MKWSIRFYSEKVKKQTLELPSGIKAKLLHILETIQELGPFAIGEPHIKPFGKGLYEIRAKGKEGIARSFYCLVEDNQLVILHSIIKKSQKTPLKELETIRKRMKEVTK